MEGSYQGCMLKTLTEDALSHLQKPISVSRSCKGVREMELTDVQRLGSGMDVLPDK